MRLFTILRDCIYLILPNKSHIQRSKTKVLKLTRAVWQNDQYLKLQGIAKPSLFLPVKNEHGEFETSIANIQGMEEENIWKYIAKKIRQGKSYKGRVDFENNSVIHVGLKLRYDRKPLRHVAMVEWPEDKDEQKSKAIDLIEYTKLILKTG